MFYFCIFSNIDSFKATCFVILGVIAPFVITLSVDMFSAILLIVITPSGIKTYVIMQIFIIPVVYHAECHYTVYHHVECPYRPYSEGHFAL